MSKNEDYLDDLLNSVSNANRRNNKRDIEDLIQSMNEEAGRPREKEKEAKRSRPKADYGERFVREFEQELATGAADDFLQNFEMELEEEEAAVQPDINLGEKLGDPVEQSGVGDPAGAPQEHTSDVSDIMNDVKRMVESGGPDRAGMDGAGSSSDAEGVRNMEGESLLTDQEEPLLSEDGMFMPEEGLGFGMEGGLAPGDEAVFGEGGLLTPEGEPGETILPEDGSSPVQDGSDLLQMLSGDDDLADIGDMLKADEDGEPLISEEDMAALQGLAEPEEQEEIQDEFDRLGSIEELKDLKKGRDGKKRKEGGFFSRLGKALFGPEESEGVLVPEEESLGNISDENMGILKELDGSGEGRKGKKGKKDKKEKGRDPKEKKEPRAKKPKKPKKEKKPKEKDNTPPLPKKPVILIALMAASILALILLGSLNIPYGTDVENAKDYYAAGDYVKAYETLAGSNAKSKDEKLYRRVQMLAGVQSEYQAYESMMELEKYDYALDALVRGLDRYDNYLEEAAEYDTQEELELLKSSITQGLSDSFGVSEEQARELNRIRKRTDYTEALLQILDERGLPY